MLLIDLDEGRLIPDEEIKATLARQPSLQGVARPHADRARGPAGGAEPSRRMSNLSLLDRQQAFGYTQEDLKILMTPMATTGEEAVGSMGNDTPISALSDKSKLLYTYFKQNFAQVTNPPIDPIREELVMSLVSFIGPRPNLFDLEGMSQHQAARSAPADPHQRGSREDPRDRGHRATRTSSRRRSTSPTRPSTAPAAWTARSTQLCERGRDRPCATASTSSSCPTARSGADRMPIPSLLATARPCIIT